MTLEYKWKWTTGTLGVEPPTVYEYLKSANAKNLIEMPDNDNGDGEVLDDGGEYEYTHYF